MAEAPFRNLTEKGLNGIFRLQYTTQQPGFLMMLARQVMSNQRVERYPGLGTQGKFDRWAGEMTYGELADTELTVRNDKWAGGVKIPADLWYDDKTGLISDRVRNLANEARDKQHDLLLDLFLDNTVTGYDGQPMFSASHRFVPGDDTGVQTNIYDASGNGTTDAGFVATIYGLITRMIQLLDDRGRPVNRNMRQFMFVYHPSHTQAVQAALADPLDSDGGTNTLQRQRQFSIAAYSEPLLDDANEVFMFGLDQPGAEPFLLQDKRGPETSVIGPGSEHWNKKDEALFGALWEGGAAPWAWHAAYKADLD